MITMTRRIVFSAAHADWIAALSKAENEAIFGANASLEPYGHNYTLDVSVDGPIDPRTGMVFNIKELDRIVREQVIQVLDRKFINRSVPAFCDRAVTVESLTEFIAERLRPALPSNVTLSGIRLEQTPERFAVWLPDNNAKREEAYAMLLTHTYEFSASHRLDSPHLSAEENRTIFGKCNYDNGHGHNYILEITVGGPIGERSGRVLDPDILDGIVKREVVDRYDHRHFNFDIPEFAGLIPSAEVITKVIWERLYAHIPAPARLERVTVRETARNIFEYRGKENDV